MRDANRAMRHRVDYLEHELAEKEAEIARLRGTNEEAAPPKEQQTAKRAKRKRPPSAPPELRIGVPLPDNSVRFVVRPIEMRWVAIAAAVALALVAGLSWEAIRGNTEFPWLTLPIWAALPLAFTSRTGFDVNVSAKSICVWKSWGPVTYSSKTLAFLKLPDVRSGIETRTNSDGLESRSRVTRLYWGSTNIRAGLDRAKLSSLMGEARALVETARA